MKLLRLTTNDNNAVFNNTINEDIKIEPGSRIALKNFTCKINPSKFFIDSTNNKIRFSADGATKIKEFRLTPGTLDINTYPQYLIELQDGLNSRLEYVDNSGVLQRDRGMQSRVDVIDEKVEIELRKGQEERANDSGKYHTFNVANTAAYLLNRISGRGDLGSFSWWELPIAKGSGRFGMRLANLSAAGGTEGVYIGLVRQLPTSSTTTFNLNDMVIGIYAERAGADYKLVINGVETTSSGDTVNIIGNNNTNNDFLEIQISEGKLFSVIKQFDGSNFKEIPLNPGLAYNNRDDLFPVVVFKGNNTTDRCRIGDPRIIVDPFKFPVLNSPDPGSLGSTIPSYTPTSPTQVFFEFDDSELARFLGFQNNRQPGTGFSSTDVNRPFLFKSTNQFAPSDLSESYLIELLNIKINSFDALINQRSNTLCTVVSDISNISNNLISYEAPFPVFIDVNNETTINLRNIRARILKEDRGQIVINGFAQMTLLITSPSDTL